MSMIAEVHFTIRGEWGTLESQWEEARQNWRDAVAERFEREFWSELEDKAPALLRAMEDLDNTLDQALRSTEI